jgi:predicted nucleic acid-binding Zn ribbon protein
MSPDWPPPALATSKGALSESAYAAQVRAAAAAILIEELFSVAPPRRGWKDAAIVRSSSDPSAKAAELARRYVYRDRGGQHRAMVAELLLRAAGLPELGRLQGPVDGELGRPSVRRLLLEAAGTVAYFPDAPATRIDPQLGRRNPPLETIRRGARRLALRADSCCIVCGGARPKSAPVDYCDDHRQHLTDKERARHKRDIKTALDWAAPLIAGGPSRVDARRGRRAVSGHTRDTFRPAQADNRS